MISKITPLKVTATSNNNSYINADYANQTVLNQSVQTHINGQSKNPSFQGGFFTNFTGFIGKAFSGLGTASGAFGGILRYVVRPNEPVHIGTFSNKLYDSAVNFAAANDLALVQGGLGLLLIGLLASIFHTNITRGTIN